MLTGSSDKNKMDIPRNKLPQKLNKYHWALLGLFAFAMVNIGFGTNIINALSCGQYYFDYLLFGSLGYFLVMGIGQIKRHTSNKSIYASLTMAVVVGVYFFELGYAHLTNCAFSTVLFFTSKSPFVAAFVLGITVMPGQIRHESRTIVLSKGAHGKIKIIVEDIAYAWLEHGILKLKTHDGTILMVHESLKHLATALLAKPGFYQLNRKTLVSKRSITEITPQREKGMLIMLADGFTASVNKNKTAAFKQWFYA